MFRLAVRQASRQLLTSKIPFKPANALRFLSTAPPSQKSRSWKGSAARWAIAIGAVYFYNTSPIFADQPKGAILLLDESLHNIEESKLPTLEAIVEEKRTRQMEQQAQLDKQEQGEENGDHQGEESNEDSEEEADQQGAFNPETGEINWDCPCLGGMADGPCGEEFKAAFSCFVYSKEEPKGMECIDKFKGMQDCFRQHPEIYGSELAGDDNEVEEELRADAATKEDERLVETAPSIETTASQAVKSTPQNVDGKPELAINILTSPARTERDGDEGVKLAPNSQ